MAIEDDILALLNVVDGKIDALQADVTALAGAVATIDGNVDAILVDTGTTLPATLAALPGDIWDELTADHMVAGSFGLALQVSGSLVDSIFNEDLVDHTEAGSLGLFLNTVNNSYGLGV
jgi:hypothetical protein